MLPEPQSTSGPPLPCPRHSAQGRIGSTECAVLATTLSGKGGWSERCGQALHGRRHHAWRGYRKACVLGLHASTISVHLSRMDLACQTSTAWPV
jgi:hypothetical protein